MSEVASGIEVKAAPGIEVDAVPGIEVKAAPGIEVEAVPGIEVKAAPGIEVEAAPGIEVKAAPGIEVEAASRITVEVVFGMVRRDGTGAGTEQGKATLQTLSLIAGGIRSCLWASRKVDKDSLTPASDARSEAAGSEHDSSLFLGDVGMDIWVRFGSSYGTSFSVQSGIASSSLLSLQGFSAGPRARKDFCGRLPSTRRSPPSSFVGV